MIEKMKLMEEYVKNAMSKDVAHSFEHVDRVRNWAIKIAKKEKFKDLGIVNVAALMHDIGRVDLKPGENHGIAGAKIVQKYLEENNFFSQDKIDEIVNAVRYHNTNREGEGELLEILRDADMLDGMGVVGLMRAISSMNMISLYNSFEVKGETWGLGREGFDKLIDEKGPKMNNIVEQINFQISWQENLKTKTAKKNAKPLIKYMKKFILQLEGEVKNNKKG